jgi:hypothetical protein
MSIGPVQSSTLAPPPAARGGASRANTAAGLTAGGAVSQLSAEDLAVIAKLKARDLEVRQHEQAHLAAAGGLAKSGASYTYQRGPDGVSYAVGGEVQIDTSPGRTPAETIERARAVAAAALAPANPSGADRAVAAQARQLELQARAELTLQQAAEPEERADAAAGGDATGTVRRAYGLDQAAPSRIDVNA